MYLERDCDFNLSIVFINIFLSTVIPLRVKSIKNYFIFLIPRSADDEQDVVFFTSIFSNTE